MDYVIPANIDTPPPGPVYPFRDPAPSLVPPDETKVNKAEISLALALNSQESGHSRGISEKEANIILQWLVYNSRQGLIKAYFRSPEEFENASGDTLDNTCGLGRPLVADAAEELGLKPVRVQASELYPSGTISFPHKFAVLEIPVMQEDGNVVKQPYLLDTSYRQFFDAEKPYARPRFPLLRRKPDMLRPGHVLAGTQEGRDLADALLRDGYVKLDEEKAGLYINSFAGGKKLEVDSYMQTLLTPPHPQYKDNLDMTGRNTSTLLAELRMQRHVETALNPRER